MKGNKGKENMLCVGLMEMETSNEGGDCRLLKIKRKGNMV